MTMGENSSLERKIAKLLAENKPDESNASVQENNKEYGIKILQKQSLPIKIELLTLPRICLSL